MPTSAQLPPHPVLVMMLHTPAERPSAERLAAIWQPSVPAAAISLICATMDNVDAARDEVMARRGAVQVSVRSIILVGIRGTEALALTVAFGTPFPICGGLLICGRTVPDPASILGHSQAQRANCRLVFEEDDATPDFDAQEALLRRLRLAGVSVQGAFFEAKQGVSPATPYSPELGRYALPAVRMGGSYLAGLVATALADGVGWST